jgi:hypothetical protein
VPSFQEQKREMLKEAVHFRTPSQNLSAGTEGETNSPFCSYSEILFSTLFWEVEWSRVHYYWSTVPAPDDDECGAISAMLGRGNLPQFRFVHHKFHMS